MQQILMKGLALLIQNVSKADTQAAHCCGISVVSFWHSCPRLQAAALQACRYRLCVPFICKQDVSLGKKEALADDCVVFK
jgi:hypothetical protein